MSNGADHEMQMEDQHAGGADPQTEAKTTALEISISWFYLGLGVGATGMLIFHLHLMIRTIRHSVDPENVTS